MAQIQNNIEAAQRRAAAQYERAVAEAKRTGKSQEVDGVTLADEGVAGAKIDADSHVTIEVAVQPAVVHVRNRLGDAARAVDAGVDPRRGGGDRACRRTPIATSGMKTERYAEAQTLVFLGRIAAPQVQQARRSLASKSPRPPPPNARSPSLVIRLRGNEVLIADLLRKTNWNALLELLK